MPREPDGIFSAKPVLHYGGAVLPQYEFGLPPMLAQSKGGGKVTRMCQDNTTAGTPDFIDSGAYRDQGA